MKHPSDKLQEINNFAYSENSLMQKAKRYDDDVKFLLGVICDERQRHAACEEDMLVYTNPAEISKVMRLELLDNIVEVISKNYNRNPFIEQVGKHPFQDQIDLLETHPTSEIRMLGEIFDLLNKHFNRPSAC